MTSTTEARTDRLPNRLNVTKPPESSTEDAVRPVFIAHRVMKGNEKIEFLAKMIDTVAFFTETRNADGALPPNPMHHWGVVVGNNIFHLQGDNNRIFFEDLLPMPASENYALYRVGETKFNDAAIQDAGVKVIYEMPDKYDMVNNNCQCFSIKLLDIIVRSGRIQVKDVAAYQKDVAAYKKELDVFIPDLKGLESSSSHRKPQAAIVQNPAEQEKLLAHAQAIMDRHTPQISVQEVQEAAKQVQQGAPAPSDDKVPEAKVSEIGSRETV